MHTPVLLKEAIEALNVGEGGLYIDATVGEGGHTQEILKLGGRVLGIDADYEQIQNLESRINNPKLKLVVGNFRDIEKIARENEFFPVDGVIFDLGLSMRQLKESGKGLSYMNDSEPLDMRLNESLEVTAAEIVNSYSEDELYEIFAKFSEELDSGPIAKAIVRTRKIKKLENVGDLKKAIKEAIGRESQKVNSRIFQALRIKVNDEIRNLEEGLKGAYMLIKKQGRIAVITFHSLEDRLVKRFGGKKVAVGNRAHKFERSAKLRVLVKQ